MYFISGSPRSIETVSYFVLGRVGGSTVRSGLGDPKSIGSKTGHRLEGTSRKVLRCGAGVLPEKDGVDFQLGHIESPRDPFSYRTSELGTTGPDGTVAPTMRVSNTSPYLRRYDWIPREI